MGILAEFEYLLNQWQISKGVASFDTRIQLNRANESKNLILAQGKSEILNNDQTVKPENSLIGLEEDTKMSKAIIDKFDEVEEFVSYLTPETFRDLHVCFNFTFHYRLWRISYLRF